MAELVGFLSLKNINTNRKHIVLQKIKNDFKLLFLIEGFTINEIKSRKCTTVSFLTVCFGIQQQKKNILFMLKEGLGSY